ncbi:MAG: thermonuclease family protein [Patescibacteria group bacterium]
MQKRLILGLIAVFLALAGQDVFFGANMVPASTPEVNLDLLKSGFNENGLSIVTRIIDGDTIVVFVDGVSEKVRLIGVDTPETVDPRKPVQCFGEEASAFTRSLLLRAGVRLEMDATQGDRDKYGRLLRYVFLPDGTLVNEEIIAEGYGHEYTYRIPYQYQTEFKTAERSARESQKGLWASGACGLQNTK